MRLHIERRFVMVLEVMKDCATAHMFRLNTSSFNRIVLRFMNILLKRYMIIMSLQ